MKIRHNAQFLICFFILASLFFSAKYELRSETPAYRFFDKEGDVCDFKTVADEAAEANLVFFGEAHNNPICHWLQLRLAKSILHDKKGDLILGAEMFETDDQTVLNEYLSGKIAEKNFIKEAKIWGNYKTDYKPLVELAKENNIPFIATNIPRRYAAAVAKRGLSTLDDFSADAKKFFPPTPIEVDLSLGCYQMMEKMGGHSMKKNAMKKNAPAMKDTAKIFDKTAMPPEHPPMMNVDSFKEAQAVKDATMAHFILKNIENGKTFLHFNGSFHSDNWEGIVWFVKKANPELKILVISSVSQEDLSKLESENENKADYIIATPTDMTKTH